MNGPVWWVLERRATMLAALVAALAVAAGAYWGTYVAGGPDSYCYLNQAELFVRGRVRDPQKLVQDAPWPGRVDTVVPVGHVAAPRGGIAVVPMCPPGYPIALAVARLIGGRTTMFWVIPILGGLAVWWTFLLGRRIGGADVGLSAAVLFAASPTFLYQVVQPMSDVAATAAWTGALVIALGPSGARQALFSGAAIGAAVLIRPNLAPLGIVAAGMVLRTDTRSRLRVSVSLVLGGLPFAIALMALQHTMYGGPFTSGYGELKFLFSIDHVIPNVTRYPVWLVATQTPLVALALVAPWTAATTEDANRLRWLLAFALVTFACYVPYVVYDAWWFLRFVLPAFPPLLVLMAFVIVRWLTRSGPGVALNQQPASNQPGGRVRLTPAGPDPFSRRHFGLILTVITGVLVAFQLVTAERRAVFRLRNLEWRYRAGGEYVARRLPPNAVVITTQQSGSVRFYSGRPTLVWDSLEPAWLDRAVEFLEAKGYRPYFLFEMNEESLFRQRFEGRGRFGGLDWPPAAEIDWTVHIYDAADYDRFRRGEKISTDIVWSR
jgi:hypothetical protein